MPTVICEWCQQPYDVPQNRVSKTRFCGRECRAAWDRARPNPQKGRPKNKPPWNKGKVGVSDETRAKMSAARAKWVGDKHPRWKGGRRVHAGYVHVFSPDHPHANANRCVPEHRLVMEKHLGRYLLPTEEVHHINGVKDDNRIENLELHASHSTHAHLHGRNDKPENTATQRQCFGCKEVKPLTREHFGYARAYKYGFAYLCLACKRARSRRDKANRD